MSLLKKIGSNPLYYIYRVLIYEYVSKRYQNKLISSINTGVEVEELLEKIINHALLTTPFYRKRNENIQESTETLQKLRALPLIDRNTLKSNKGQFKSSKFEIGRAFNTSGTSGDPLYFLRSASLGSIVAAHQINTYKNMGFKRGDRIVAFNGFEPSSKMLQKNIFWKKNNLLSEFPFGSLSLSANSLNEKSFDSYFKFLEKIRPAIIRGYPSAVSTFFKLMEDRNMAFSFKIKAIELTSENIYDHQVELIRRTSKADIYRQYGHTECAMYAMTDADSTLYKFSPLFGYLEVLNEFGEHVAIGEVGEIVVTSFHNYLQPFIRYKTGDLGRYEGLIDGFQAISEIIGREQDFLMSRKGDRIPITSIVSGSHLTINEFVTKWQIVQVGKGVIKVRTLKQDMVPKSCLQELDTLFKRYVDVEFEETDVISLNKSGKFQFFITSDTVSTSI